MVHTSVKQKESQDKDNKLYLPAFVCETKTWIIVFLLFERTRLDQSGDISFCPL